MQVALPWNIAQPWRGATGWTRMARAPEKGPSNANTTPSRGRVLIVEDEYFVALNAEDALSDAGFTVIGLAATAEEAARLAEAGRPDLVLMDIRLAGLRDGIAAAADIRQRFGISSLFATAHSDAATKARGDEAASPLGWLTKPYTREEVTLAVANAMTKARQSGSGA